MRFRAMRFPCRPPTSSYRGSAHGVSPIHGVRVSHPVPDWTITAHLLDHVRGGDTYARRRALFGEKPPRTLLTVGASIGDPLTKLPSTPLSVELHAAAVRLLVTEALIGSGSAPRITRSAERHQGGVRREHRSLGARHN